MGATFLHTQELALDKAEAKKLSDAIEGVNAYYKVAIDPKKMAWINLGCVGASIYGQRVAIWKLRMKMEQMQRVANGQETPAPKSPPPPQRQQAAPAPSKSGPPDNRVYTNGKVGNASPSMFENIFGNTSGALFEE